MDVDDTFDFDLKKKKKKKRTLLITNDDHGVAAAASGDAASAATTTTTAAASGDAGASSASVVDDDSRPLTYAELLERVYTLIGQSGGSAGPRKVFMLRPPQVVKHGTKRVAFVNFARTCKTLQRMPAHLQEFINAELATTSSIDGSNNLIIKGRYDAAQMQAVLRQYVTKYVFCHSCKSPETCLKRDGRMTRMRCDTCTSEVTVDEIRSGFQAQVAHRHTPG